jgi:drug/metabolite transporter (DMT)-like permease
LLTALALQTSSTAHSAVVVGALPMATAAICALRTGHRPSKVFWAAAAAGAAAVIAFTLAQNYGRPTIADLYLFAALLVCAAGYAEGGWLSARMPGWRVIAWGVVIVLTCIAITQRAKASPEVTDLRPGAGWPGAAGAGHGYGGRPGRILGRRWQLFSRRVGQLLPERLLVK